MGISVYQIVTDRIIAEPEKGIITWERPWTGVRDGAYSRSTGRPYSLLNQMLLGKPGEWLTYKQAQQAGGQVRKGENGSIVVFWKIDAKADKDAETGDLKIKQFPILRYYTVFHVDQCDGIEPKYKEPVFTPLDPIAEAEAVLSDYSTRCYVPIIHEKSYFFCVHNNTSKMGNKNTPAEPYLLCFVNMRVYRYIGYQYRASNYKQCEWYKQTDKKSPKRIRAGN